MTKKAKAEEKKKGFFGLGKIDLGLIAGAFVFVLVMVGTFMVYTSRSSLDSLNKNTDVSQFPENIGQVSQVGGRLNYESPWFFHKVTSNYSVLCTRFRLTTPAANGASCKLLHDSDQWDDQTQAAIGAIVYDITGGKNGVMSNTKNYYYGELAINEYLYYKTGNSNNYTGVASSSEVKRLVNLAKNAEAMVKQGFSISLSSSTFSLSKSSDGKNYVSNTLTVKGSSNFTVSVSGVSGAKECNRSGSSFQVCVPAENIKSGTKSNLTVQVNASQTYPIAAKYNCGGSYYQSITPSLTYTKKRTATDKATATIGKPIIKVGKIDATTNKYVAGAKLLLTGPNNFKKEITTTSSLVTIGESENLAYGTYTLKETKAPNGYIASSETKTISLSEKSLTATLTISNYPTGITISKKALDQEGELPGAVLRIIDENGTEKARWTTTTSKKSISNLAVGTYYLEEVSAPAGYKKSNAKIKFTINSDGTLSTDNGKVKELELTNDAITATISKTDIANSAELPGAQLQILDEKGTVKYEWISTTEPHVISRIPAGNYILVETQEPTGYVLNKEQLAFSIDQYGKIKVGGSNVEKVVMTNEKTKVKISKQDVTNGKEVPGAQLEVKDKDGKVVDKWTSTKEPHMIEGLAVGKYYLTEKIAPKGYVVSEEKIEFEIKNDGTVDTVVMLNTPIVDVPNTASAASIVVTIIGVISVAFGGWMIFKNVKVKKAN